MKIDVHGGLDYEDDIANHKAANADLVTLPLHLQNGINCSNCVFYKALQGGTGFCLHQQVQLPVTKAMCCKFQDSPGMLRNWKK